MASQRHAWVIDEVRKYGLSRANRQTISHDRSFVAWPVKLHRHNRSTNGQSFLTQTETLVALYHITWFPPGKAFPARVSKKGIGWTRCHCRRPSCLLLRELCSRSYRPWPFGLLEAGSVASGDPSFYSCISYQALASCEQIWRCDRGDLPVLPSHTPSSLSPSGSHSTDSFRWATCLFHDGRSGLMKAAEWPWPNFTEC